MSRSKDPHCPVLRERPEFMDPVGIVSRASFTARR
jgi:hypothetical protein